MAAAAIAPAPTTKLYAELPRLELRGVSWEDFQQQPLSLQEYTWKHCEDQIRNQLKVGSVPCPCGSPSLVHKKIVASLVGVNSSNKDTHSTSATDDVSPTPVQSEHRLDELLVPPNQINQVAKADRPFDNAKPTNTPIDRSQRTQLEWMQEDLGTAARKLKLLEKLADVQGQYLDLQGPQEVFRGLLTTLLEVMDAEYGFVAEVKYNADDDNAKCPENRYMQPLALADAARNAGTRAFFRDFADRSAAFHNHQTLVGHVMTTEEPVVTNSPSTDSRSGGLLPDHPPLHAFLGVPFFNSKDGTINGMVALANKKGGFRQTDVDFLEPCLRICGNLLQAYQARTPHISKQQPSPQTVTTKRGMKTMETVSLQSTSAESGDTRDRRHIIHGGTIPNVSCCDHVEESLQDDESHVDMSHRHQDQRIQELELANIQLGQARQQVVRQSAAQLQHFACSSHEIRTPLNCIIGLSSLLQETDLNPMQAESMQLISSSSELLLQVVNDVLDYSKLESGHVDVKIQRSNMQDTLLGVVQSMELKTRDKNIRVRTDYSPFLPPTWTTDRLRLQQILFNLLGNAFKFSDPDSCIDLKVELGAPGRPSVASHAHPLTAQCVLRFIVQDYGCGIQPHQLENIFKPFVQAGDDTKKLYEGTGLGLAITTRLVKALGGCVYANSVVNEGSEFVVEFPYEDETFDVVGMGRRLTDTTVLLVPGQNMLEDRIPIMQQILESYDVSYRILDSMEDLDRITLCKHHASSTTVTSGTDEPSQPQLPPIHLPSDRDYVCLIDESVFQSEPMQRFTELPVSTVLLSFGPGYEVAETSRHYRNLLQIVPSVLMQSFADVVDEARPTPPSSPTPSKRMLQRKLSAPLRQKEDVSILAAEDNMINQKVLKALLKKLGYTRVSFVGNGKMAVDAVEQEKYDVVLMDVQMPVMDGLEATRLIGERQKENLAKEGNSYVGPKVVFVTATVDQTLEDEAKELGAVGFVPKPFNLRQLESCMTEICRSLG